MAAVDDIKTAAGCLSTVFPQFVAKELATLTDQIASTIQGFTDPLAALGDLNVDSLIDNVNALSENDIYSNLAAVATGLTSQYASRELEELLESMATEFPSVTKRVHQIRNMSGQVVTCLSRVLSVVPDMPYLAAQRMCALIIELTDLKNGNLMCLRKHIVQLVNAVLVLAKSDATKAETFQDLDEASVLLGQVQLNLSLSQPIRAGVVGFDSQAFERARQGLLDVKAKLTPDKDGTSLLDAAEILAFESVPTAQVTLGNRKLVTLVIPSLINLIEVEISAVVSQVQVINFYLARLGEVIDTFREVGTTSNVKIQRARAIKKIQSQLDDLIARIDLARERKALRAASGEMLLWSSRVKAIIAMMDSLKELELEAGSIEGPDKAFLLHNAFLTLLGGLTSITNDVTVAGVENPLPLRDRVLALTKGARRIVKDIENGGANASRLLTFHAIAMSTATAQINRIDDSSTVAAQQKALCQEFNSIELQAGPRFEQMLGSMRQLGLDRGLDLLGSGQFKAFLDSGIEGLSYLGIAIQCLEHGIRGTDDTQTKQQLGKIRDNLIGQRSNLEIAAADSADQGRFRFVKKLKSKVAELQKNAKTVEAIVAELQLILTSLGEATAPTLEALQNLDGFSGDLKHLAVGAGGRLAAGLEEFSEHPNAGVVLCD